MLDFGALIDPVTVDAFGDEYWERRPLVVERNEGSHFSGLLTLSGVEELIGSGRLRYPECRLVKDGEDPAPVGYVDEETGAVQMERLQAELREGATIVLSGLERHASALDITLGLRGGMGTLRRWRWSSRGWRGSWDSRSGSRKR